MSKSNALLTLMIVIIGWTIGLVSLVIWAVSSIDDRLTGLQSLGGVGITASAQGGFVVDQYVTSVPMGKNEVWIIDQFHGTVQVVTRNKDGSFHWSAPR